MPLSITSAEQFFSMATSLLPMLLGKNAFFNKPQYTLYIRVLFGVVLLFQLGCFLYIRGRIQKVNDQRKFKYKSVTAMQEQEVEISVHEYDSAEVNKGIRSLLLSALIALAVHWKFKGMQPMFSFVIGVLKPLLFSGLFREYIYGQKMRRPWDENYLYGSVTVEDVKRKEESNEVEEIKEEKEESEEKKKKRKNKVKEE